MTALQSLEKQFAAHCYVHPCYVHRDRNWKSYVKPKGLYYNGYIFGDHLCEPKSLQQKLVTFSSNCMVIVEELRYFFPRKMIRMTIQIA
jgi:hypothetical protein